MSEFKSELFRIQGKISKDPNNVLAITSANNTMGDLLEAQEKSNQERASNAGSNNGRGEGVLEVIEDAYCLAKEANKSSLEFHGNPKAPQVAARIRAKHENGAVTNTASGHTVFVENDSILQTPKEGSRSIMLSSGVNRVLKYLRTKGRIE